MTIKPTRRTFLAGLSLAPLVALFRGAPAKAEPLQAWKAVIPPTLTPDELLAVAKAELEDEAGTGSVLFGADFRDYEASIPIKLDPPDGRWGDIVRNASQAIDRRNVIEYLDAAQGVADRNLRESADRWATHALTSTQAIDRRLVAEFAVLDPHAEAVLTVAKKRGV